NCGVTELKISKDGGATYADSVTFDCTELGARAVKLRVRDAALNAAYCDASVTVNQRPTTLVYGGATIGQYSDCATVTATLTDTATGTALQGRTVTFTLQTSTVGATLSGSVSAMTDASGVATTTCTLLDPPGTNLYKAVAQFAGNCPSLAC